MRRAFAIYLLALARSVACCLQVANARQMSAFIQCLIVVLSMERTLFASWTYSVHLNTALPAYERCHLPTALRILPLIVCSCSICSHHLSNDLAYARSFIRCIAFNNTALSLLECNDTACHISNAFVTLSCDHFENAFEALALTFWTVFVASSQVTNVFVK